MQRWPFSKLRKFLPPLRAWWFSHLDLSGYDLVISSSGAEAKAVKVAAPAVHINYCHAPTHYYWSRYDDYIRSPGFGFLNPLARLGLRLLVGPMRRWDYKAAQRPHYMIANSAHIKNEIKKYYGRDAEVIYPPVDIERFAGKAEEPRRGFVTAGRQTPYKRIDLAVAACSQLNVPLVVLGSGPEHGKLKKMAGKSVTFLRGKDDEEIAHYFKTADAFIFPGLDDFGIVAVEALAAGTPVIAYKAGGALDYIEPGKTGVFFEEQTVESLAEAIEKFKPDTFSNTQIQKSATKFSPGEFNKKITAYIRRVT
jgi:glycosyltransferase involved in cell wall biosynthesis